MLDIFEKKAGLSEAEKALKSWGIKYKKKKDGSLVVPGDLDISGKGLRRLPDFSNVIVAYSFDCSNNLLTSLAGSPRKVGYNFLCNGNRLTSLEGASPFVGNNFDCHNNKLTSLRGAPETVGFHFACYGNQLASLKHVPRKTIYAEAGIATDWGLYRGWYFIPDELLDPPGEKPSQKPRGFNL